jgi:hypothetical protein
LSKGLTASVGRHRRSKATEEGGSTNEALESVCGVGFGHAAQVTGACFESAGYAASESLRTSGASQPKITAMWRGAELAERLAQCQLLREFFGYRPGSQSQDAELGAAPDPAGM